MIIGIWYVNLQQEFVFFVNAVIVKFLITLNAHSFEQITISLSSSYIFLIQNYSCIVQLSILSFSLISRKVQFREPCCVNSQVIYFFEILLRFPHLKLEHLFSICHKSVNALTAWYKTNLGLLTCLIAVTHDIIYGLLLARIYFPISLLVQCKKNYLNLWSCRTQGRGNFRWLYLAACHIEFIYKELYLRIENILCLPLPLLSLIQG